jgi:hypothetical protein
MSLHRPDQAATLPLFDPVTGFMGLSREKAVQVSTELEFTNTRRAGLPMVVINQITVSGSVTLDSVRVFGCGLLAFSGPVTLQGNCSLSGVSFGDVVLAGQNGWSTIDNCTVDHVLQIGGGFAASRCVFRRSKISLELISPKKALIRQCFFDGPYFLANISGGRAHFSNCIGHDVSGRFFSVTDADLYSSGNIWRAAKGFLKKTAAGFRFRVKPQFIGTNTGLAQFESMDDVFENLPKQIRTKSIRRPSWVPASVIMSDHFIGEMKKTWSACPQ